MGKNAGFNIDNFRAYVGKVGIQKNSKFLVQIPTPIGLFNNPNYASFAETNRQIEFWCDSVNLPNIGLYTHQVLRYGYGVNEKRPFAPIFTDVAMSFIADGNGSIWNFLSEWLKMIVNYDARNGINPVGSRTASVSNLTIEPYELSYKYEYTSDATITIFNDAGYSTIKVTLRDGYPTFLGDLPLNWQDTQNISRIPLTFTFMDWYSEKVSPERYSNETPTSNNSTNTNNVITR